LLKPGSLIQRNEVTALGRLVDRRRFTLVCPPIRLSEVFGLGAFRWIIATVRWVRNLDAYLALSAMSGSGFFKKSSRTSTAARDPVEPIPVTALTAVNFLSELLASEMSVESI
jgi:hypothetical protein